MLNLLAKDEICSLTEFETNRIKIKWFYLYLHAPLIQWKLLNMDTQKQIQTFHPLYLWVSKCILLLFLLIVQCWNLFWLTSLTYQNILKKSHVLLTTEVDRCLKFQVPTFKWEWYVLKPTKKTKFGFVLSLIILFSLSHCENMSHNFTKHAIRKPPLP